MIDLVATGAWIVYLRRRPELTWRRWRLERGGVFGEGVQLFGGHLGARHYPNVTEFEITHHVERRHWFGRGNAGSRHGTDVLWFSPAPLYLYSGGATARVNLAPGRGHAHDPPGTLKK